MEIEDFLNHVRACTGYTSATGHKDINVWTNPEHTKKTIASSCKCDKCSSKTEKSIVVKFKEAVTSLKIFQAEMLYAIFVMKKKPHDYSQYHKCVAGKRFIENIESIEV